MEEHTAATPFSSGCVTLYSSLKSFLQHSHLSDNSEMERLNRQSREERVKGRRIYMKRKKADCGRFPFLAGPCGGAGLSFLPAEGAFLFLSVLEIWTAFSTTCDSGDKKGEERAVSAACSRKQAMEEKGRKGTHLG